MNKMMIKKQFYLFLLLTLAACNTHSSSISMDDLVVGDKSALIIPSSYHLTPLADDDSQVKDTNPSQLLKQSHIDGSIFKKSHDTATTPSKMTSPAFWQHRQGTSAGDQQKTPKTTFQPVNDSREKTGVSTFNDGFERQKPNDPEKKKSGFFTALFGDDDDDKEEPEEKTTDTDDGDIRELSFEDDAQSTTDEPAGELELVIPE